MLQGLYQLKVTLTDVEYDMREMDLCSVWGNYLWNAATVSKPVCVWAHASVCVRESVCMRVLYACPCMKGSAYTPHSAEGTWSGEQHAETAAAHRSSKQLNMSCCQINRVSCSSSEIMPSLHHSYDFDSNAELYLITMSYYYR